MKEQCRFCEKNIACVVGCHTIGLKDDKLYIEADLEPNKKKINFLIINNCPMCGKSLNKVLQTTIS